MDVKNDLKALFDEIDDLYFTNEGFKFLMESNHKGLPETFLVWLKTIYETDVIMRISRILELNKRGITLSGILKEIKCDCKFVHLCTDIQNDLKEIEHHLNKYKTLRNKRKAHFDRTSTTKLNKTVKIKHSDFDCTIEFIINLFDKYNRLINGKGEIISTVGWDEMFKNIAINYNT